MQRVAIVAMFAAIGCRAHFDAQTHRDGGNEDAPPLDDAITTTNIDASITPGATVFGTTAVGGSTQNSGQNRVWMSKFTVPETGTLQRLVAYLGTGGGQGANVRGVVYNDGAGAPTTLFASTQSVMVPGQSPEGWVTLQLASPTAMPAATYWIGVHDDSSTQIAYQTNTGATKFDNDTFSDGSDPTWQGGTTTYTMQISIYAEYTVP